MHDNSAKFSSFFQEEEQEEIKEEDKEKSNHGRRLFSMQSGFVVLHSRERILRHDDQALFLKLLFFLAFVIFFKNSRFFLPKKIRFFFHEMKDGL